MAQRMMMRTRTAILHKSEAASVQLGEACYLLREVWEHGEASDLDTAEARALWQRFMAVRETLGQLESEIEEGRHRGANP
jgi:hypothetical protein|tara:strand:+ start:2362 stop:2601 length:240 start_codon:yes stop_codon:yes gene_type:complete